MPFDPERRSHEIGPLRLEFQKAFQRLRPGGLQNGRNEKEQNCEQKSAETEVPSSEFRVPSSEY